MSEKINGFLHHQYGAFLKLLPDDWEQKEITQIGSVVGGGTPSRDVPSFWRGAIPWVTPGEVSGENAKLFHDTTDHISASGLASSGANLLPAGSLLVTTRATLGARVINAVPMATNQGFKSIVFKRPEEASYYFHLFEKVKPELIRRASGTTFLEISGAEFGSIKVPSPSQYEKLKIFQILDTLDTVIHETEAIISKLKAVKQGLLHDLLTRGIDANGELRPPQAEAPHLYKLSPMGWIPKEWEVDSVAKTLTSIAAGKSPSCQDVPALSGEWGVLKVSAVHPNGFRSNQNKVINNPVFIVPEYEVKADDLLITRANTPELVGYVSLVKSPQSQLMLCDKTLRLNVNLNVATKMYLFLVFQQPSVRTQIEVAATGTSMSMKNISQASIRGLQIPIPPLLEQAEIGLRIGKIEQELDAVNEQCAKLLFLKSGLMDDLLTGRVRVTPLLAEAAQQQGSA